RTFRALTLVTLISTYLLIVLGSTVRVTESGMGCKGWPLCSGQIGPIDQFHPLLEQSHRYLASIVTILIFSLAIVTWRSGQKGQTP
ncbi:MAG: COX15/CtaA family protein, partial [Actinobacteria bacterium]|nr:COX15/CtaA family protein [Actinomycetota bacterium]